MALPPDSYFCSDQSKIIFALMYLDGEIRAKLLGINESLYESKRKAKLWRGKLIKKIHPDYCADPLANEATTELNNIYERMIQHAD